MILAVGDRHFKAFYALKPINKRLKIEDFKAGLLQMFHLQQPLNLNLFVYDSAFSRLKNEIKIFIRPDVFVGVSVVLRICVLFNCFDE